MSTQRTSRFLPFALIVLLVLLAGLGAVVRNSPGGRSNAAPIERTAGEVLEAARALFSKIGFHCGEPQAADSPVAVSSVDDLWREYVCERGEPVRRFTGAHPLVLELAKTDALHVVRQKFYASGQTKLDGVYEFNLDEFVSATGDMIVKAKEQASREFSITHFLGSFEYTVTQEGERVRFSVHNVTDRASGTRIPMRFPNGGYTRSLESLLAARPDLARRPFMELIAVPEYGLLSVLEGKSREATDENQGEGGGAFEQTFEWTEQYLPDAARLPLVMYQDRLAVQ